MSLQTFLLYLATWSLVALTPGPAVMCSMAQASRHGFRASLTGIAGIEFGNFLFFVCIALGLGTLLATATTAFTILRFTGAVYLFYLGIRIIISTCRRRSSTPAPPPATLRTAHRNLFIQGLLIQLTNPKALLFMSALLPQFIDAHRPVPLQLMILMFATIAIDLMVLPSYALLAHRGVRTFQTSRLSDWLKRVYGAALVFFGVRLLVSRK